MSDLVTVLIVFVVGLILGGVAIISLSATGRRRRRDHTLTYKE